MTDFININGRMLCTCPEARDEVWDSLNKSGAGELDGSSSGKDFFPSTQLLGRVTEWATEGGPCNADCSTI